MVDKSNSVMHDATNRNKQFHQGKMAISVDWILFQNLVWGSKLKRQNINEKKNVGLKSHLLMSKKTLLTCKSALDNESFKQRLFFFWLLLTFDILRFLPVTFRKKIVRTTSCLFHARKMLRLIIDYDLPNLDFFLWCYLKEIVLKDILQLVFELKETIRKEITSIG